MPTRDKIIQELEKNKGVFISGEELAKRCNVSRNAVWKNINELKKNGYSIRSVNNRGYMLEKESDIISKSGVILYLLKDPLYETAKDNTERIFVYEELDSTNTEAKRNLFFSDRHMINKTVIIAKKQTAGIGHRGSDFASPDGGIYLSMILEPDKIKSKDIRITETVALAVSRVIERLFKVKTEKREDDSIYFGDGKIAGILTEGISDLETGIYSNYIIGIGIRMDLLQRQNSYDIKKNEVIAEIIKELDKQI
ncbi:MAG: biotin--[acetyl-CoA-carboxylase] ligase [Lachnospiraceae bacterium]|nr:biotin--[acetyl-CoA-carboxylase] ligase [Lachnospiraceae bacterium]